MESLEKRWERLFWSGDYADAWGPRTTPEKTLHEVEGALQLLQLAPGAHILDWCGGEGRHSILFAQKGFEVTLLDFAPVHIERAREAARAAGVQLDLVLSDFRQTPVSIQADAAINMFTAGIGYLQEADDLLALQSLFAALKPGACFLLDTMNLFWLVRNYQPVGAFISSDRSKRVIEERSFDFRTNRNTSHLFYWVANGKEAEHLMEHRIYSAAELVVLLRKAGFEPQELYGDFDGSPLTFDSRRLIVVSRRP